jgi:hypothetical protein
MNSNLMDKINKYESIAKGFNNKINKFVNVLDKCTIQSYDSLQTIICKKYIELSDVVKVATYINSQGYRIETNSYKRERKYTTNDITAIVDRPDESVDSIFICAIKEMRDIDKMIMKMNAKSFLK